ncbi:proteasome subunit beta [Candidatus Woesearchaeota archaeon]|nr:proteasome subunit beta [Candidatus Woesearchaeota archaeon]
MEDNLTRTGTTTVGIKCKDGVILAADKRATAGHMIVDKRAEKIHQLDSHIAITIAGLVSDAQFLTKLARAEIQLKKVRTHAPVTIKEAANLLANLSYANIRKLTMVPGIVGFLVGGVDAEGGHLYNIGVDGSITEEEDYTSDGSGSVFAYGVFETLYRKDMPIEEGMKLAMKAINAALQRDSASGNGIDIITITKDGVKRVLSKKLEVKVE